MDFYTRALELKNEIIENRRYFHTNAEVGLHMPMAQAYVMKKLTEYGLNPIPCGNGVTAILGAPPTSAGTPTATVSANTGDLTAAAGQQPDSPSGNGKVLLLRADMDALPMAEESGEPFACPTGTEAHTCGHDFHAAMLLTAAKMLKEQESRLKGTVKFMFQTAEETLEGSRHMIENGILENPKPDAALAFHITSGQIPIGVYMYNSGGAMMFSADSFRIHITGKGAHGAYPHVSIDPINIAAHIYLALQALIARESNPLHSCALTIGHFESGTTANVIPDTALLEGSIRTNNLEARDHLVRRMKEVVLKTAELYGGSATVEMLSEVPPLICNPELTDKMVEYMNELPIPGLTGHPGISASASEDFALIAERIPSTFIYLSAGYLDERGSYPAHNPKVQFNEEVCPIGAACLAHCAVRWLEDR